MTRYAKKTKKEELEKKIQEIIKANEDYADELISILTCIDEIQGIDRLFNDLMGYEINGENVLTLEDYEGCQGEMDDPFSSAIPLLGYHTVNEFTFLGILMGSDYGVPVYLALYLDEDGELRAYLPTKGNSLNPLSGLPFGEEPDLDIIFANNNGSSTLAELEEKNYRYFDCEQLKQDIENNIKVR